MSAVLVHNSGYEIFTVTTWLNQHEIKPPILRSERVSESSPDVEAHEPPAKKDAPECLT